MIDDLSRTYLTTHQVARMVGASPSTVLSWVDRGWLPAHRTPGGHRRIERQALVEFLRAHDMPELASESEPTKLQLALRSSDDARLLAEGLRTIRPDLRVDVSDGIVETLARLFESAPDALLIDGMLAGVDIEVLCRELCSYSGTARVRVVVVRPTSMARLDDSLRMVGVWAIVRAPASPDEVADCLSLNNFELVRPKAS